MRHAHEGAIIRTTDRGPPWIVVDNEPSNAILAKWPGRLWKVRIIEAAEPKNQPNGYAGYVRANAVEIIQEEGISVLFGPHGREVTRVLERAMALSKDQAEALATKRHAEASAAYDRVFRHWAESKDIPHDHFENLDGTLKLGGRGSGSPIYEGLSVLHTVVFERAKSIDGEAATESDDEAEWLVSPWSNALSVLSDAALAVGAPDSVSDEDREILLSGWTRI